MRLDLIQWLASLQNAKVLHQIALLKEAHAKEETSSTLPGVPFSEDELVSRIQAAQARIQNGHFTSMEDLEKEMEESTLP